MTVFKRNYTNLVSLDMHLRPSLIEPVWHAGQVVTSLQVMLQINTHGHGAPEDGHTVHVYV